MELKWSTIEDHLRAVGEWCSRRAVKVFSGTLVALGWFLAASERE